ncbi:MAG: FlgD immunoglobulin-like domain containing protein [Bacteroidales bacterium]|nr:FlgD immunoglobulin-like domain containing protein [Bacteroidales bacterium]
MKRFHLNLVFVCAFLWIVLGMNQLYAQVMTELTVPDYAYGLVGAGDGATSSEGVAQYGPYGNSPTVGELERPYDVFIAHGYRWWGFFSSGIITGFCVSYPTFNYPGYHGVWDMSGLACVAAPGEAHIGFNGSWGGVVVEPASRKIWSLIGASNKDNGPTEPYIFIFTYPPPSIWGSGSSDGYLRKIVQVQSTGALQTGDPVQINASLISQGVYEGDGEKSTTGALFLNKLSETPWYAWGMGREYLRWGDVADILGNQNYMNNMLGNLVVDLNAADDTTTTVAIGDFIIVEVALHSSVKLNNPGARGFGESQGWIGEKPLDLFSNTAYSRTDSVRNLIKKHGISLTYDLICLTPGAVLEPLSPAGPNTDVDMDGISDTREKGPDGNENNYDGNADGLPDHNQASVASFHTFDGQDYVSLVVPEDAELSQVIVSDNPSPTDSPEDAEFPFGFFDFSIDGLDLGEAITVTLYLHGGEAVQTYYKYGYTPDNHQLHWYEFMYDGVTGAEINGDVITLHFVDGLRGDEDITVNGSIKEPGGPMKDVATGIREVAEHAFVLEQNYPNPFTGQTKISYQLNSPARVVISVYNLNGKELKILVNQQMPQGKHEVVWDGRDDSGTSLNSGIYSYRMEVITGKGSIVRIKTLVLVQ